MRIVLTSLLISLTITHAFAQQTIFDENAKERKVGSFHGIDAAAGIEVIVVKGDQEKLAISIPDESLSDKVISDVRDGILYLQIKNDWKVWKMPKNWKVKAYVSYKHLDKVEVSSGASIKGEIETDNLVAHQSSGGIIGLRGRVGKLSVSSSSGGMFRGYELSADFLDADVSSGGGIQVTVLKEVNAEANSGGYINYKGEAVIRNIKVNSGGAVKRVS